MQRAATLLLEDELASVQIAHDHQVVYALVSL